MDLKFALFATILAIVAYFSAKIQITRIYQKYVSPQPSNKVTSSNIPTLYTPDDLKLYNGVSKPQLFLSILGKVYDVSRGSDHYGPGKSYNIFVGRDSTRSFVSGDFEIENANDGVADLSPEDLRSLDHWANFYAKEYKLVGKLIGKYYEGNGKLTTYGKIVKKLIKDAHSQKDIDDLQQTKFPPCNVEWDVKKGTHVWCTEKSGGINRDWIGLPRKYYEPGAKNYRCACINSENLDNLNNLEEYEDCDKKSYSCFVKNPQYGDINT